MTIDEVRCYMKEGAVIECENVYQREEAVQFLIDIGYELHLSAKNWLKDNPDSTAFLNPGLDDNKSYVTCWSATVGKQKIRFKDIETLITQNDLPIDERGEKEFLDAFTKLMS